MANFALTYAQTGNTFVLPIDEGKLITLKAPTKAKRKIPLEEIPGELQETPDPSDDERIAFIDTVLQPGDNLWTEMGGAAGPFVRRAHRRGVQVWRVPYSHIPETDEEQIDQDEENDQDDEGSNDAGTLNGIEAARKQRALTIADLSVSNPEVFYQMRDVDSAVALISIYTRMFYYWQKKLRIKAQQQLTGIQRELAFVDDDELGKRDLEIKRQFASDDLLVETIRIEGMTRGLMERALKRFDLYGQVFEPISGCGPNIAAGIIDVVQDIRRFESEAAFRSYSGWFPRGPEGKIVKRRRGETLGHSTKLKQALNLFGDQVAQYGHGPDEWKAEFTERKEADITAGRTRLHAHRRAKRRIIGRMVEYIYGNWWLWEVTGGDMQALQVPEEDLPVGVRVLLASRFPHLGIEGTWEKTFGGQNGN